MEMYNPAHPGKLLKEYINGFTVSEVAEKLKTSRITLSRILNEKAPITSEMALRLSKLLPNTTPNFWLGMQSQYDVWQLKQRAADFDIKPLYIPRTFDDNRPSP